MSRYEPPDPIKQKEREDLIEKVKEMTSEESKGGKRERSVEVDSTLSWDHEGLSPLPKAPKDGLKESPKPPRTPKVPKAKVNAVETFKKEHPAFSGDSKVGKYPEIPHKGNKDRKDKKKYRDMRVNKENESHEESDTEDSYEFENTSQQLSQVTPGEGALKIKLSRKKPLKITAGAPDGQSETIPMELECNWGFKRTVPSSHVDTTSDSTLPPRETRASLFITPIHPENNERSQKGTSPKRANDLKCSTNYGLTKERVTQVQGSDTRGSQVPVRVKNPPGNGGGGDSSGGTGGNQRFPGEGRGPPRRNGNQGGGGGDDDPDPSDDRNEGDSSSSTDSSTPRKRKHKSPKYVYVLQGPPGPKGQEGQPGQAGRDGRDGQNLSLIRELEETLKAHRPNLDTTGLENSFDQFGRTMFEVLSAQHRTNQKLEEQFCRANETQEYQVEAMQDMAQANFQMKYDHMFAGVPIYDGTDPVAFDDWLYQIESLCELSHRDVRVELMGQASAQVKRIIRSLPMDIDWEIARRELKRCLTEEKSRAHSAFKLAQIKQKPNENLRIFILRYQDLHSAATGKTAAEDTDPTHIIRFLGMMTNSEIARKITQKGIPEGMTLGQAFTRAIELEAGYQLSEGVSLARHPEIMQVQEIEKGLELEMEPPI